MSTKKVSKHLRPEVAVYLSRDECDRCNGSGKVFDSHRVGILISKVKSLHKLTDTALAKKLGISPQVFCDLTHPKKSPRRKWTLKLVEKLIDLKDHK